MMSVFLLENYGYDYGSLVFRRKLKYDYGFCVF